MNREEGPRRTFAGARSQGLVEFALILPLLLLTVFMIIELARVLHAWLAIENGARFGVRYAITREYDSTYCVDLDADGVCDDQNEEDTARLKSIKDAAKAGAVAILRNETVAWNDPGYFKVTVCTRDKYQAPDPSIPFDSADCNPTEDIGKPGDFVSVTVDFNHPLITPFLTVAWPQLHLNSRREAIVEEFRTSRVVEVPPGLPTLAPTETFTVTPTFTPSLTPTPTFTPSPTFTSTPTPTPDCSDITMTGMWISGDDVEANIRNRNVATAFLVHTHLEWEELRSAMYVNEFELDNFEYWSGDDFSSPTDVSSPIGLVSLPGNGNTDRFEADFNGEPREPIWGTYRLALTFDFLDWAGGPCVVSRTITAAEPPTSTPRPSNTPGPSPTPKDTKKPSPTKTTGPTATDSPPDTPVPTDPPGSTPPGPGD